MSYQIFALRLCVEGVSLSVAQRLLGVSMNAVTTWYRRALDIMAWDALRRQSEMTFGRGDPYTVDVEVDEKSFKKWRDLGESPELTTWRWYPWIMVAQRGRESLTWMAPLEENGTFSVGQDTPYCHAGAHVWELVVKLQWSGHECDSRVNSRSYETRSPLFVCVRSAGSDLTDRRS